MNLERLRYSCFGNYGHIYEMLIKTMGEEKMAGKTLFDPIVIGTLKIKNRIAMAPMGTLMGTYDGYVTDQLLLYYNARAKGGVGLVIVEQTLATNKYGMGLLGLWHDGQIAGFNEFAESVHAFGSKIIIQLSPGLGRQGKHRWTGVKPVAPSAVPYVAQKGSLPGALKVKGGIRGDIPRELSIEEIVELEDLFADAAGRARLARCDGIEIHAAHGYLIFSFLSPRSNRRTDLYGGTVENRLRFLTNIINKVRKRVGSDFVVGCRISADEHVNGGLTCDELIKMIPLIEQRLDYIHVSSGTAESYNWCMPEETDKILPEAIKVKEVASIPVLCPNIHSPEHAESAIKNGKIDMIALGRPLLADPEWPKKVMKGEIINIQKCLRDNNCLKRIMSGMKIKCIVNPEVGLERFNPEYYPPPKIVKYW